MFGVVEAALGIAPSAGPVCVTAVLDPHDDDLPVFFVDAVQHPVGTSSSRVDARQVSTERLAQAARVVDQGRGEELDHCSRDTGKSRLDCSDSRRGQDQLVGGALGHGRNARTASTPRTTSPAAYAAAASRMSAKA